MKTLRLIATTTALATMLTLSAAAAGFTPSIERKDAPQIVENIEDLIVTPVKDITDAGKDVHEDIEESLTDAKKELAENALDKLAEDFAKAWEEATKGAPVANAVVSDIFDIRYGAELGTDGKGAEITLKIKLLGVDADDLFVLLANDGEKWAVLEYEISADGVITIKTTTKSVIAVVKDNEAPPADDPNAPDSPKTGVDAHFVPAVAGVVAFAALAGISAAKASKGKTE